MRVCVKSPFPEIVIADLIRNLLIIKLAFQEIPCQAGDDRLLTHPRLFWANAIRPYNNRLYIIQHKISKKEEKEKSQKQCNFCHLCYLF